MKKVIKKIALYLIVLFVLVSYASAQKTEKNDSIFLISTYLDLRQPILPAIDAAVLNKIVNPISNEITLMFKGVIDTIRVTVAEVMQNELKCTVIYGAALQETPGFNELKENYDFKDWLLTEDKYFPEVVTAKGDINPFKFEKGKIEKYFKNSDNYNNTIADISKSLSANYIAVSQTLLCPIPGSMFKSSNLYLVTHFYLFRSDGKCIGNTFGQTELPKGIQFQPEDVNSYEEAINQLPDILVEALNKFTKKNKIF